MKPTPVELIVRAVLYEGYILYPYRASALKNRHRWSPGGLAPGSSLRAECLAVGDASAVVSVCVRFLHPLLRTGRDAAPRQEAAEREVAVSDFRLGELTAALRREVFAFPASQSVERAQHAIEGAVEVSAGRVGERVFRVAVQLSNLTPLDAGANRDDTALRSLASAHAVLRVEGGEFVSLTDPPEELRAAAADCRNEGVWPVLVGEPGRRDTVLASPIILPDYPAVAPESPGDFFDGTEIDEMLALRVLTLTDDEKRQMAADPRSRAVLERVEGLSADRLGALHGAVRLGGPASGPRPGDRVRLRPRGRADAFDVLLAGKIATVVSVEVDFEGTAYLAVTVDDDPGGDLGAAGQAGHRFFFRPEEVERLPGGDRL
jgi:hypothetical protein